jgi:hypothetical protein
MPSPQRPRVAGFLVLALVCLNAGSLAAQTPPLGEVARKEQERRKAMPPAGKVYTNKDVPKAPEKPEGAAEADAPAAPPPAAAADAAAPSGAAPAPPAAAAPAESPEAVWRKRMADAREALRRSELFAEALQTRINSLSRDYLSRDDPAQRTRLARERKEAIEELARVKQDVERARKQIADVEEDARKAGVPPGWLR